MPVLFVMRKKCADGAFVQMDKLQFGNLHTAPIGNKAYKERDSVSICLNCICAGMQIRTFGK
jgi:hypothetical protein